MPDVKTPFTWRDGLFFGAFAAVKLLAHLLTANGYGMFRDEFYYLECANHLALGYVDHPPLSIALLALTRALFGDSMLAVRFPAAVAGAVVVVLGGLIARAMGGKRFAQGLACLALLLAPVYLGTANFYSMNVLDQVFWGLGALILVRILQTGEARLWLCFGLVAGLGLQNKLSMGFFGAALAIAMTMTPERRFFKDNHLWIGGAIAFLIFSPNLVWQVRNGWPTLEFMRNASLYKNAFVTPWGFLANQLLLAGPVNAVLWMGALGYSFAGRDGRKFRLFAITFITLFVIFVATRGKSYYLAPAYLFMLPLGALWFEQITEARRWGRSAMVAATVTVGLLIAPYALPVLPVETFLVYQKTLGIAPPREERAHTAALPQHFGDRFGWPEMVKIFTEAYHALPEADRARCSILVSNYGQAGAINYYGRYCGLPKAISGYNNYFLWGPGEATGEVMLVYMKDGSKLAPFFEEVTEVARFTHPYAMGYENDYPLFLCRGLKMPIHDVWPALKTYY